MHKWQQHHFNLHKVNNYLFTLILVVNLYTIAAPFMPQVIYWWDVHHTHRQQQLQQLIEKTAVTPKSSDSVATTISGPNRLVIPVMMLDQQTLEGPESNWFNILYKGIWRWPGGSTPNKGGNTIFLSHRFSYTGPRGAFYYLNKLQIGDNIGLVWNNKLYTYSVVSTNTVPSSDTSIENNTPDAQITLFTCTPLWHPVDRLVVVAKLKEIS
jgi:sortase A